MIQILRFDILDVRFLELLRGAIYLRQILLSLPRKVGIDHVKVLRLFGLKCIGWLFSKKGKLRHLPMLTRFMKKVLGFNLPN